MAIKFIYNKIMRKKGFINIIIIGVIAIIIAAAGYFAVTRKTSEAPATSQEVETINKTTELTGEDSATKDWKTYRNEEYGFEFRYPLKIAGKPVVIKEVENFPPFPYFKTYQFLEPEFFIDSNDSNRLISIAVRFLITDFKYEEASLDRDWKYNQNLNLWFKSSNSENYYTWKEVIEKQKEEKYIDVNRPVISTLSGEKAYPAGINQDYISGSNYIVFNEIKELLFSPFFFLQFHLGKQSPEKYREIELEKIRSELLQFLEKSVATVKFYK